MSSGWLSRLGKRTSAYTARRMAKLIAPRGVVSFSFDDAPKSSCTVGRDVLESHGCRGTWYVAGGLTDQFEQGRVCHSLDDLRRLQSHGHHIACHTYQHTPATSISLSGFKQQLTRNQRFLDELGVPPDDRHFSFPLGEINPWVKHVAGERFVSCRTISGGVQVGRVDLHGLWAMRIYEGEMSEARLAELARSTADQRGWLIYYTHDVEPAPSQWGCTPRLLSRAVELALSAGCEVLPVNEVVRRYTAR